MKHGVKSSAPIAIAFILSSTAALAGQETYRCQVADFNTGGSDPAFTESNMKKTFLITVLDEKIVVTMTMDSGSSTQTVYSIFYSPAHTREIYGLATTVVNIQTIAITSFKFEDAYQASITYQSPLTVNSW
ncbi:MAG: hypothetical protein ACI92Z_002003 [Paracoccaceae bacterium]|jgi:hypothetical protein